MKYSTETFIQKAKEIHGEKYDYSKVEVVGTSREKVTIICPVHGEFSQRKDSHLSGAGCKKCLHEGLKGNFKLSNEEYKEKVRAIMGDSLILDKVEFKGTHNKVTVTCPVHGDYKVKADSLYKGYGCQKCNGDKLRTTLEDFLARSKEIHDNYYDYSLVEELSYSKQKVKIICPVHGVIEQMYSEHMNGVGCRLCKAKIVASKRKLTLSEFISRSEKIHNHKFDYSLIETLDGVDNKVPIICPTHGIIQQSPAVHLSGRGCKKCSDDLISYDMVKRYKENPELGRRDGEIYIVKMYDDNEEFLKIGITCNKKGRLKVYNKQRHIYSYEFLYTKEMSNLESAETERELFRYLKSLNFKYKPSKKFTGRSECYSLDCLQEAIEFIEDFI